MRVRLLFFGLVLMGTVLATTEATAAADKGEGFRWSDLLPRGLQKNPRLNLSVFTDLTPEGKKVPVASPEHPVYYALVDGGYGEGGDIVAGEKPPQPEKLAQLLKDALAKGSFQPADGTHPATVVVYYRWGVYNHVAPIDPAAGDETGMGDATIDTSDPKLMHNVWLRANLVGGPKFAKDMIDALQSHHFDFFENRNQRTEMLVAMALSDLYFVVAAGYDAEAAKQNKKVMWWITRISTDSSGVAMDETLPALVKGSGAYIGHETQGPVLFHPRLYPGKVEIGEAEVKGIVPESGKKK